MTIGIDLIGKQDSLSFILLNSSNVDTLDVIERKQDSFHH